jgi:3-phosphoshikimate 1-carboxyvinyltransferase
LGVQIDYLAEDGFPPIQITGLAPSDITVNQISVAADTSSQFISALLMIAPCLPLGLTLEVLGSRVSWSYVQMTIALMQLWGAGVIENTENESLMLHIAAANYQVLPLVIEPDWSSASYWCSMVAVSSAPADVLLSGLNIKQSVQGDAGMVRYFERLGVVFEQEATGVRLTQKADAQTTLPRTLTIDFTLMPDMAQTIAVTCAALGVSGIFSGLSTLVLKETNRITALKTELAKVGVTFVKLPSYMSKKGTQYMLEGKADLTTSPEIETYQDHRMAMSFAAFAQLGEISIQDPSVVRKSYPTFWEDVERVVK